MAPRDGLDSLTGKVVKITDGDTLYVLDANYKEHKIRLSGIDAPERKQAYGLASRKHLVSIVAGKQVTVEYQERDRYGRIVGKVLLDGIDACLEQVKAGFAWHFKKYQNEQRTNPIPLLQRLDTQRWLSRRYKTIKSLADDEFPTKEFWGG